LRGRNVEPLFDRNTTTRNATISGVTDDYLFVPRSVSPDEPDGDQRH
jgi:hypothetical protein